MMKTRNNILAVLVVAIIISISTTSTASAYSPEIRDIDISVRLDNDGTAYITEVWDVTVADGTEWYLVQDNLGDIQIFDFQVKDETGRQYIYERDWDVDRSINEKAGKCGIVNKGNGSYELCWGVGRYGDHKFIVSYKMTNVVKHFSDADGFNNRFVNPGLSSDPQHIKVTIFRDDVALTDENTDIWAFGFGGTINFTDDGKIVAESSSENSYIDYVNIMVGFTSGVFNPTGSSSFSTFEELKTTAFKGSDYESGNSNSEEWPDDVGSDISSFLLLMIFLISIITILIRSKGKRAYNLNPEYSLKKEDIKSVTYSRDIPFEGSITASYHVLKKLEQLPTEGSIISAYLLRWLHQGKITIKETPRKVFLGLFGESMQPSIVFENYHSDLESLTGVEASLFKMLFKASGGDKILQEKEFFNWSKENYKDVQDWLETASDIGKDELVTMGDIQTVEKKWFFKLFKYTCNDLSSTGRQKALNMLGFKKYLEDFTIINERKAVEVQLWDDYLVFASLFGIADKVSDEFKELCPEYFFNPQDTANVDMLDMYIMMRMINVISYAGTSGASAGLSAAQTQSSIAGSGGFSSFGGGGGFSGGGFGGGSR